jgi:predicted PurR-regulated permease PerM
MVYLIEPLYARIFPYLGRFTPFIGISLVSYSLFLIIQSFFLITRSALEGNAIAKLDSFYPYAGRVQEIWAVVEIYLKNHISYLAMEGISLFFGFLKIGVIIIVVFYVLASWGLWIDYLSKIAKDKSELLKKFLTSCDKNLRRWAQGQFLVFLCLLPYYYILLSILNFPFSFEFAVITTALSIIPYLGIGLCAVFACFVGIHQGFGPQSLLLILMIFAIGMVIEGSFLSPKFIGSKIDMHPIFFLLLSLVLFKVFGFIGPIITAPLLCLIKAWFDD